MPYETSAVEAILAAHRKTMHNIDDVTKIQCAPGNWDHDPYMHGMANGLILAQALVRGVDPTFLDAPDKWLESQPRAGKATLQP